METTVVLGVRRIDPEHDVDEVVDVLIVDGRVARVGSPGEAASWPETADARNITSELAASADPLILCPGLVDIHTHIFGSVGVPNIDQIGVRAGVPTIVDAGGAGALTIDDFVAHRSSRSKTRTLSFLSIEASGITEHSPAHSTGRSTPQMKTASMDDFLGAVERHTDRIVGLKVWASAKAGASWVDFATNLGDLIERPLLVHVGEIDPLSNERPISGEVLDRLQGGDIVTHCFTALPGALIGADRRILPEVHAARSRGVLFDPAPGLVNLRYARALAAMEQGWLPDLLSSDTHRFAVDLPGSGSILGVMNSFLALGMSLRATIERASVRPAKLINVETGRPVEGEPATLSLLRLRATPLVCSDGFESITTSEWLEPVGCFLDGTWFAAGGTQVASAQDCIDEITPQGRSYLVELSNQLSHLREHDSRWRGAELHGLVHRSRVECGLSISDGLDAFYAGVSDQAGASAAAGWLLEELGPDEVLNRLADAVRDSPKEAAVATTSSLNARAH